MKKLLAILILLGVTAATKAQPTNATDTLKIKTSAVCEMCKDAIEQAMAYEKGVKSSSLDTESKVLTVVYKADKTSPDKIRKTVSLAGYDADDVPADPAAYKKLHTCCKKDSH